VVPSISLLQTEELSNSDLKKEIENQTKQIQYSEQRLKDHFKDQIKDQINPIQNELKTVKDQLSLILKNFEKKEQIEKK